MITSLAPLGERGNRKAVGEGVTQDRIQKEFPGTACVKRLAPPAPQSQIANRQSKMPGRAPQPKIPNRQSNIPLPLPMAYHRERQRQVSALPVSLHLDIPVARVILGDGGKSVAANRRAHQESGMGGAGGKPAQLHQVIERQYLVRVLVVRDGRQNEGVASGIHAHMVSVLGDQFVAQGVEASLDGLTAKIRRRIGEVQNAQKSSHGQSSKEDVRRGVGVGAGGERLAQPYLADGRALIARDANSLRIKSGQDGGGDIRGRSANGFRLVTTLGEGT